MRSCFSEVLDRHGVTSIEHRGHSRSNVVTASPSASFWASSGGMGSTRGCGLRCSHLPQAFVYTSPPGGGQATVDVAQLVEPRVVIPAVVGSSPIVHPVSLRKAGR